MTKEKVLKSEDRQQKKVKLLERADLQKVAADTGVRLRSDAVAIHAAGWWWESE